MKLLDFVIFLSTVCTIDVNLINLIKSKQRKIKHNFWPNTLFTNLNQNSQDMKNQNMKCWLHRLISFHGKLIKSVERKRSEKRRVGKEC